MTGPVTRRSTFVLLTTFAPHPLATQLESQGYRTLEALEVSEVLHLLETESIDAVVITSGVEGQDTREIYQRIITLTLGPGATYQDVIWEWTLIQPGSLGLHRNPKEVQ
jgi:hypothetical protein